MTKEEKLDVLNSMFVTEYDAQDGIIHYIHIENNPVNIEKLKSIGVPAEKIQEEVSTDGETIEISKFVWTYGEAEWYQNEEFLGYAP